MNEHEASQALDEAFEAAMIAADLRFRAGDRRSAFTLLERAHVLGQRCFGRHMRVHRQMLRVAWDGRDWREVRGQLLRLFLTPLGHLTGRLPVGNTGGSNVSAFAPMPVPPELQALLDGETQQADHDSRSSETALPSQLADRRDGPRRSSR